MAPREGRPRVRRESARVDKRRFECLVLLALVALGCGWRSDRTLSVQGLVPGLSRAEVCSRGPEALKRALFIGDVACAVYGDTLSRGGRVLLARGDSQGRVRAVLGEPELCGKNWPISDGRSGDHYWRYGRVFVELDHDRVCGLCLGT